MQVPILAITPFPGDIAGLADDALAFLVLVLLLLLMLGVARFYVLRHRRAQQALVEANEQLTAMVEAAGDGILLTDVATGKFLAANPAICRMLGYSREELLNLSISDIHPKEDLRKIAPRFGPHAELVAAPIIDLAMKRKDGSIFLAQANTAAVAVNGRHCRTAVFRDVTAARASEEALKQAHAELLAMVAVLKRREREMTLLARLHNLMLACDAMDEAYAIIASAAVDLFPGMSGALALTAAGKLEMETVAAWGDDRPMLARFAPDDCWALRTGQACDGESAGTKCRHFTSLPSGAFICLPLTAHGEATGLLYLNVGPARAVDDDIRRLLTLFGEVVKLSLSNLTLRESLRELATRDPLTGLFNRRYLDENLSRDLARASRSREPLCLAMLDIDRFKTFNDENGHDAGDEVLKAIADVLKRETRAGDIACRFGGEEFVLVLYGLNMSHALLRLNRICGAIKRKRVIFGGKTLPAVTVSVGLAMAPEHGTSREELVHAADTALYCAKRAGRGRVVAFSDQKAAQAAPLRG